MLPRPWKLLAFINGPFGAYIILRRLPFNSNNNAWKQCLCRKNIKHCQCLVTLHKFSSNYQPYFVQFNWILLLIVKKSLIVWKNDNFVHCSRICSSIYILLLGRKKICRWIWENSLIFKIYLIIYNIFIELGFWGFRV